MVEQQHYFQIPAYRYVNDPVELEDIGVAFEFHILPDGDKASIFKTKVFFSVQFLMVAGKKYVPCGVSSLSTEDQKAGSEFFRYAFYRLKEQLEASNLTNRDDINADLDDADQLKKLPKQCDFLASSGESLFCRADSSNTIETSALLCNSCILPEPVRRCDNLRIRKVVVSKDAQGKYQITPECYCVRGNAIPDGTEPCVGFSDNEPDCWIPFKFRLRPIAKPTVGFSTQSS